MKLMNRRRFLVGTGGAMLALPFLERLHGTARATGEMLPKRLIVVTYSMGTVVEHWLPPSSGPLSGALPYITAPLEPFRDRCLFVSHCDNAVMGLNAQHAFGHPAKKEGALTGTLLTGAFAGDGTNRIENVIADADGSDQGGPNGESVCHFIGSHLRRSHHTVPSVDLSVAGRPERDQDYVDSEFFFEGPANPVSLQANPGRAFNRLFAGIDPDGMVDPELEARRRRTKSVLDAVRASFVELQSGLGAEDRRRLTEHAERIRQIELDVERVVCAPPIGIPHDGTVSSPWDPYRDLAMVDLAPMQSRILASAMACDLAPVGRLEFSDQHNPYFGLPIVDDEVARWRAADSASAWHSLVHGDPSPVDGVPTRPRDGSTTWAPALLDGYRFFVEQFAGLLGELDAIVEGPDGRTALDNSLVVLASDYGNGNGHSSRKLGYILAGNTGPGRLGWHHDCAPGAGFYTDSDHNVNHLLTSIINMFCLTDPMGRPYESFGLEGFATGVIPGLFA